LHPRRVELLSYVLALVYHDRDVAGGANSGGRRADSRIEMMTEIARQILATRAHVLAGLFAFWAVCGVLLGVVFAVVAYRVLRRAGAFELN
jgi:hypothetical protein